MHYIFTIFNGSQGLILALLFLYSKVPDFKRRFGTNSTTTTDLPKNSPYSNGHAVVDENPPGKFHNPFDQDSNKGPVNQHGGQIQRQESPENAGDSMENERSKPKPKSPSHPVRFSEKQSGYNSYVNDWVESAQAATPQFPNSEPSRLLNEDNYVSSKPSLNFVFPQPDVRVIRGRKKLALSFGNMIYLMTIQ